MTYYNEYHQVSWTPLIPSDPPVFEETWWNSLTPEFRQEFTAAFPGAVVDSFPLPHPEPFSLNLVYCKFFLLYKSLFYFPRYASLIPSCRVLRLTPTDQQVLTEELLVSEIPNPLRLSRGLRDDIRRSIQELGGRVFVKTHYKSAKKDRTLTPASSVYEVLVNLSSSMDVVNSLLQDEAWLVLRPWKTWSRSQEFRAFVLGWKVRGICSQFRDSFAESSPEVIQAFTDFWIPFNTKYADATVDFAWVDGSVWLIEINSGGRWSTAGSAWFTWDSLA